MTKTREGKAVKFLLTKTYNMDSIDRQVRPECKIMLLPLQQDGVYEWNTPADALVKSTYTTGYYENDGGWSGVGLREEHIKFCLRK